MESKKLYVTIRDYHGKGSKDGCFFVNCHSYEGGMVQESNNFEYRQKRTARRIAKRLAAKMGYEYRQDMEYTHSHLPGVTAPLPVEEVTAV
jgi:hypothetical protein